jgi:UDP-glucose 4-epimerase
VSLNQMADIVKISIPEADIEIGPGFWHLDKQGPWNIDAAARELDYQASRELKEGIADYIEWLRNHAY